MSLAAMNGNEAPQTRRYDAAGAAIDGALVQNGAVICARRCE